VLFRSVAAPVQAGASFKVHKNKAHKTTSKREFGVSGYFSPSTGFAAIGSHRTTTVENEWGRFRVVERDVTVIAPSLYDWGQQPRDAQCFESQYEDRIYCCGEDEVVVSYGDGSGCAKAQELSQKGVETATLPTPYARGTEPESVGECRPTRENAGVVLCCDVEARWKTVRGKWMCVNAGGTYGFDND